MGALKSIAGILTMIVALIVIAALGWTWWTNLSAHNLAVKEQAKAGAATVTAGQAQAQVAAQQIVVSGQARDRLDIQVHQDNANAIEQAPGASQGLDPAVLRAARLGLCRHPSVAADPGCAELRQSDPAFVPPAGPVGSLDQP